MPSVVPKASLLFFHVCLMGGHVFLMQALGMGIGNLWEKQWIYSFSKGEVDVVYVATLVLDMLP
jgi:hypothetical protein